MSDYSLDSYGFQRVNVKKMIKNLVNSQNSCTFAPAFRARSVRTRAFMYNYLIFKVKKQYDYCTSKRRREHREGPQEV